MRFPSLPQLDHPTVLLRPLAAADIAPWFTIVTDARVIEHTSWNVQSPAELQPFVFHADECTASSPLRLAIVLRDSGALAGTAGFHTVMPQHASAELAYELAAPCWGRGIATAVCSALLHWAHGAAGLTRVQATVLESNRRSAAVLQRCGFQHEGLLRAYRSVRGVPGNFHMYAHVALPPGA